MELKGTVRLISSNPPCNDCNCRFTTVPLKAISLINYELDIDVYYFENIIFFNNGVLYTSAILLQEHIHKLSELNTFNPRKG